MTLWRAKSVNQSCYQFGPDQIIVPFNLADSCYLLGFPLGRQWVRFWLGWSAMKCETWIRILEIPCLSDSSLGTTGRSIFSCILFFSQTVELTQMLTRQWIFKNTECLFLHRHPFIFCSWYMIHTFGGDCSIRSHSKGSTWTHTYNPCLTWETQATTKPQLGLRPIQWPALISEHWLLQPHSAEAGCPKLLVNDLWNGLCDLSPTSFCSNWSQTILTMNDIVQLIGPKTKKAIGLPEQLIHTKDHWLINHKMSHKGPCDGQLVSWVAWNRGFATDHWGTDRAHWL